MINKILILIPAYNPSKELLTLVQKLTMFNHPILIINDGSHMDCMPIFNEIEQHSNSVTIHHHKTNKGKGSALKTGIAICEKDYPNCGGIITADADGQHSASDIIKVAKKLIKADQSLILGVRNFIGEIPFRSRFGNIITRKLLSIVHGIKVLDTQTGLRGIPVMAFKPFLQVPYDQYEFETEMLICAKNNNISIEEVGIETIYINDNEGSHFNPILDSMKIYFVLFRFLFSSLLAAVLDIVFFIILFKVTNHILFSILISRYTLGAGINFYINWKGVFKSNSGFMSSLIKYYILATILGGSTFVVMEGLTTWVQLPVIMSKVMAEGILFAISFIIQKRVVFDDSGQKKE